MQGKIVICALNNKKNNDINERFEFKQAISTKRYKNK